MFSNIFKIEKFLIKYKINRFKFNLDFQKKVYIVITITTCIFILFSHAK